MAEDPALPLTDVQLVLGHALLTTTQLYLTPRKEDVIRRILAHHVEQVDQARQRAQPAPAPGRAAVILAARGGALADIRIGDVLELLDTEADVHGAARTDSAACYRLLRQTGIFGPAAPMRLRELRTAGQRTAEEMIDRHNLACRPARDLLVDYLRERQPAMDYGSLEQLARKLGMFWADLEAHHPGIDSLHLSAEVADAWKQRMRTKQQTTPPRPAARR